MKCNHCGADVNENMKVCPMCGQKLNTTFHTGNNSAGKGISVWLPAILAVLGVIISWELQWLVGLGLGVAGAWLAKSGGYGGGVKAVAYIAAGITVFFAAVMIFM